MNTFLKKFLSVLLCLLLSISFVGCGEEEKEEEKKSSRPKSSKTEKKSDFDSEFERLVICSYELSEDKYYIKSKSGTDYLMVEYETFKYSFRIPYLPSSYPDLSRDKNGLISIEWNDRNEILLQANLEVGSTKAIINGAEYDMGMAPEFRDETLYIPSNFFISLLEMDKKYDRKLDTLFIDRKEDFPKEILLGKWSDISTNLFVGYQDLTTGLVELPSFAEAYAFNKDGTYRLIMVSTGGYKDAFLHLEGKYIIHGNTIACYDILETLYEGTPLKLVHEDKRLENPHYEYIANYNPDEDKIELTFWLNRVE